MESDQKVRRKVTYCLWQRGRGKAGDVRPWCDGEERRGKEGAGVSCLRQLVTWDRLRQNWWQSVDWCSPVLSIEFPLMGRLTLTGETLFSGHFAWCIARLVAPERKLVQWIWFVQILKLNKKSLHMCTLSAVDWIWSQKICQNRPQSRNCKIRGTPWSYHGVKIEACFGQFTATISYPLHSIWKFVLT